MNSALAMSNPASPSSDADAMDHSSSDERDGTPASTQEEKDVIEAFTFSSMPLDAESRKRAAEAEPETTTRIKVARTEPPPRQIYPEPSFDTVRHDIAMKSKSMVWEAGELLISLPEHPAIEPSPAWTIAMMVADDEIKYETMTYYVRKSGSHDAEKEQEKWRGVRFTIHNLDCDYFLLVRVESPRKLTIKISSFREKTDWTKWSPNRNRKQTLTQSSITPELIKFYIKHELRAQGVRSLAGPRIMKAYKDITTGKIAPATVSRRPSPKVAVVANTMPLGKRRASAQIENVMAKVRSRVYSPREGSARRPRPKEVNVLVADATELTEPLFDELDGIATDIYSHVAANFARAKSSVRNFVTSTQQKLSILETHNRKLSQENAELRLALEQATSQLPSSDGTPAAEETDEAGEADADDDDGDMAE